MDNCRDYYLKNREKELEKKRTYKAENLDTIRRLDRIRYWRLKQKELAQQELRNGDYPFDSNSSTSSFPTFGLSELLIFE